MKEMLTPEQQFHAQNLAAILSHTLGNIPASKAIKIAPSVLWRWKHGKSSPTPANYEKLKIACEELRLLNFK